MLIVEDDPLIAHAMAEMVEDNLGCAIAAAGSVAQAMGILLSQVGFGILDVELADGLSFPLASRMMQAGIPFVFVSGSDPRRVPASLASVPFFRKPVLSDDILAAARCHL